mmetsp:Transcript_22224/g.50898  ORF Transcript_22224/g.50898 Transcript_22224/m.50898 type:complete len:112 (+) Transcript_22224:32-367(+)
MGGAGGVQAGIGGEGGIALKATARMMSSDRLRHRRFLRPEATILTTLPSFVPPKPSPTTSCLCIPWAPSSALSLSKCLSRANPIILRPDPSPAPSQSPLRQPGGHGGRPHL